MLFLLYYLDYILTATAFPWLLLKLHKSQINHRVHMYFNQSPLHFVEPTVIVKSFMSSLLPDLYTGMKINQVPSVVCLLQARPFIGGFMQTLHFSSVAQHHFKVFQFHDK